MIAVPWGLSLSIHSIPVISPYSDTCVRTPALRDCADNNECYLLNKECDL